MGFLTQEQIAEMVELDAKDAATSGDAPQAEAADPEAARKVVEEYIEEVELEADQPEVDEKATEDGPMQIREDGKYLDPATGEVLTGAELKAQRLMQADYTRKTQELARHREEIEAREAKIEEMRANIEAQREQVDPLSELDPDDPVVRKLKATEARLESLARQVEEDRDQLSRERLEMIETRLREKYPVMDDDLMQDATRAYLWAKSEGKDAVTYEQVVAHYASREEKRRASAVAGWKEKHRRKPSSEPIGAPAGASPARPTGQQFMKEGLSGMIAREDAERAKAAQR